MKFSRLKSANNECLISGPEEEDVLRSDPDTPGVGGHGGALRR